MIPNDRLNLLFGQVLARVRSHSWSHGSEVAPPPFREVVDAFYAKLEDPQSEREQIQVLLDEALHHRQIDEFTHRSCIALVGMKERFKDHTSTARALGEMELLLMRKAVRWPEARRAALFRQRGCLMFLNDDFKGAFEEWGKAMEIQPTAHNMANVLAALLRLNLMDYALTLLETVRRTWPDHEVGSLDRRIATDLDLAPLRD